MISPSEGDVHVQLSSISSVEPRLLHLALQTDPDLALPLSPHASGPGEPIPSLPQCNVSLGACYRAMRVGTHFSPTTHSSGTLAGFLLFLDQCILKHLAEFRPRALYTSLTQNDVNHE